MSFFEPKTKNETPRELIPEGKYTGILYLVVDVGSREDSFQGVTKIKREVYLAWELVDTKMADGRPFVIGNFYTMTSGKWGPYFSASSNINKMLRGWTGLDEKACSRADLLGKLVIEQIPCTITVGEQQGKKDPTRIFNIIESVKPYKGKDNPVRYNNPVLYALLDGDVPDEVHGWLKARIENCLENEARKHGFDSEEPGEPVLPDEDVPF